MTVKRKWNHFKQEFDPSTVGVLLTSHPRQQMFWDQCLPSWNDSPYYVLLGYDDVNSDAIVEPLKKYPGVKEVFATGARSGHIGGELMQLKMGFEILYKKGFHYILKLAADFQVRNLDGIEYLWQKLEEETYQIPGEGKTGSQIVGDQTAWLFGCAGILYTMVSNFDIKKKKGGSAELFCMRHRRLMNITMVKLPVRIFEILDMTHMQGLYARENKITIQNTWDIGEIYGN
jgi:hypothetical protein